MIGIIGAMEDEVVLLRGSLEKPECTRVGGFEFFSGRLAGKPVALVRCGIGKVQAAIGCTLLIDRFKPDLVINTGSAGGVDPALTVGSAVISEGLVYHDVDVRAFGYALGQVPGLPAVFPTPESLIVSAERAVEGLKRDGILPAGFAYTRGLIASGDVFMHEPERIAAVRQAFPGVKALEMEGAAVAQVCFGLETPALIIRALSDIAGTESPVAFHEFLPVASKHSAEIVRRLLSFF
ncbi:MAG: 5'-methylthioadenosine/S-adenosylhomocysteine nucleosidase [Spirochaetaceae bacterium]|jgi:adenosylhomocysteine nucleosidase|nr:5'-methylthioadenosine/S-adenosylhomocysteine nucleosidase [Spirochaetaceae bacterium]